MNTAFFLRTRTIQLDIFWRRYFLWFKTRGISPTLRGMTCPVVCTMPAPALCVPCLSLCDSVGTSSVRLIGKKLRKHQLRGWTCNTERSSKKCQYTSNLHERVLKPNALESQQRNIGKAIGSHSCCETNQPYSTHQITHPCGWVSAAKRAPGLHPATKSDQTGHRGYHIFSTLLVGGMNMAKHGTIKSDQVSQFKNCHQLPVNPSNGSICFIHKIKKPMVPVTRDSISLSAINLPCQSSLFEQQFRENQRLSPNPPKNTPA